MSDNIAYDIKKIIRRLENMERDMKRRLKEIQLDLNELEKDNKDILHRVKEIENKLNVLDDQI